MHRRTLLGCLCCVPINLIFGQNIAPPSATTVLDSAEALEKHSIYLMLTCALVAANWRIRRSDPAALSAYAAAYPGKRFDEYFGHNIGALLLGADDQILAFEMNDSTYQSSSLQHAEVRAIETGNRKLNRLRYREGKSPRGYASLFEGCTLYTTLESCTQCSGVMQLAGVDQVIFAQVDSLQQNIGSALFEMHTNGPLPAARPIKGDFSPPFAPIAAAYSAYQLEAAAKGLSKGTTAFLSSVHAYRVYAGVLSQLQRLIVLHPQNRWHKEHALEVFAALSNPSVANYFSKN